MNRARRVSLLTVFLAAAFHVAEARVSTAAERGEIQWPAPGLRDLQSAIDLAPDGGVIRIKEGVYEIGRPLFVRGKRLTLAGAGNGLRNKRATQLVGPAPQPVVDERGGLILPGDAVQGLWNFIGANVVVQDMRLSGFDAAIVTKADESGRAGPTVVDNVVIADTGRGILSLSPAMLKVTNSTIMNTRWHGISVAPKFVNLLTPEQIFLISGDWIIHPGGAGIYFDHALVAIDKTDIVGGFIGGIVGFQSSSWITNSTLAGNQEGGIVLEAGHSVITGNHIMVSSPVQPSNQFGDGIILASTDAQHLLTATVSNNVLVMNIRAGLSNFGADVTLKGNQIMCSTFDLDGELRDGVNYSFHDDAGNQCGCGLMAACQASSSTLSAPTASQGAK